MLFRSRGVIYYYVVNSQSQFKFFVEGLDWMSDSFHDNVFKEINEVGVNFFKEGDEINYLRRAYETVTHFLLEEDFHKCAILKKAISEFTENCTKATTREFFLRGKTSEI